MTTFTYDSVRRVGTVLSDLTTDPSKYAYDTGDSRPSMVYPSLGYPTNMVYDTVPRVDEPLIVTVPSAAQEKK